jgi:tetratricopeptide (TPR) repeat protein/TolB-like protein
VVPPRPIIAVLDFKPLLPHPDNIWISPGLAEMFRSELAEEERIQILSGPETTRVLRDLDSNFPDDARLAALSGASLALEGSYALKGNQIRVDVVVRAMGEPFSRVVSATQIVDEVDLFAAVRSIGASLRSGLGSIALNASTVNYLPETKEGRKLYFLGLDHLARLESAGARDLLAKAVHLEPERAAIRVALAEAWMRLGYESKFRDQLERASKYANQLPRMKELEFRARLYEARTEPEKALKVLSATWEVFPDSVERGIQLVEHLCAAGKASEAEAVLKQLRSLPKLASDDPRLDLAQAAIAEARSDFLEEVSSAEVAERKATKIGARSLAALALRRKAWGFNSLGRRAESQMAAAEAAKIYRALGDHVSVGKATKDLADSIDDEGHHEKGKLLYRDALQAFQTAGFRAGEAVILNNMGFCLLELGEIIEAENAFEKSLQIADHLKDQGKAGLAWNGLGIVRKRRGDLLGAYYAYSKALKISENRLDEHRSATILGNRAIVDQDLGNLEKARVDLKNSMEQLGKLKDEPGVARSLGSLGELAYLSGDMEMARELFGKQMKLSETLAERRYRAYAFMGLGKVSRTLKKFADAERYFMESRGIREDLKERGLVARTDLALSQLFLLNNSPSKAAHHAKAAHGVFRQQGERPQEIEAEATLAASLCASGKMGDARKHANHVFQILPSIKELPSKLSAQIILSQSTCALTPEVRASLHMEARLAASRLGYKVFLHSAPGGDH